MAILNDEHKLTDAEFCVSILMIRSKSLINVCAGIDQTRGWFYSLMVLSTILFDKPAFKNLVCNGMVLAADGKKMSKSLRNYPVSLLSPFLFSCYAL